MFADTEVVASVSQDVAAVDRLHQGLGRVRGAWAGRLEAVLPGAYSTKHDLNNFTHSILCNIFLQICEKIFFQNWSNMCILKNFDLKCS
jgi:hypothetical protein